MPSNQISPRVPVVEAEGDLVNAARVLHHQVEPRLTRTDNVKKKRRRACWVSGASYLVVHDGT